jgi:hypothetical protein
MKACPAATAAATRCRPSCTRKAVAVAAQVYRRRIAALLQPAAVALDRRSADVASATLADADVGERYPNRVHGVLLSC